MISTTIRARLLASSMITGATVAAFAGGAFAQTATPAAAPAAPEVQEFVVTGSRIPTPNLTSVSPVTSISSKDIKLQGTSRVEDLLNQLPQVVADQGGFLSNGATGTATVSLRGLGPSRTLVLIDGRRLVPGDPGDPVADINFIPAALVDRIEVDEAGASAVYGSDAVAGVVNFVMKKDFEGLRLDINYGGYQHDNNNAGAQATNAAHGFTAPSGGVYDGGTVDVTAIFGANSPDGKGNVEGYVSYRHIDPVLEATRDYSNCTEALNSARTGFACGGSSTNPNGRFLVFDKNFNEVSDLTLDTAHPGQLRNFNGATDEFNYGALNYYQRSDERYSGGFFGHYDISKQLQAYASFMFMDDHTTAQIAPSGIFGQTINVSCSNPLLTASEVQSICTNAGFTTSNPNVVILRRNVEGGDRQDDLRHTDYRAVVGLKGDLDANWSYDIYGQYGTSIYAEEYLNDVSKTKIARALNVVTSPTTGQPVCESVLDGTDPACVPYDIWTPGGVTAAAAQYLSTPGFEEGSTTEQVVSASVTGQLGNYGLKSPFSHDGLGVALGAEYRRETSNFQPDVEFQTGDLAGQGAAVNPVAGAYDVKELFGEMRIPVIQDMPFVKEADIELGYRYSHYSSAGDTSAYKISGDWRITEDVRVRGGFNRAVRAPNIDELYTAQHEALDGSTDPCSGAIGSSTLIYTEAQCANTGVSAKQYGTITPNPAAQYNGIIGGNPDLKPETADTYSAGVVFTPHHIIPGASLSIDYFNIKITNVIQAIGADNIIDQCALTGSSQFCSLVHRDPNTGSLWLNTDGYITDVTQNLGFLQTAGVDFAANYHFRFTDFGLKDYGGITIDFLGTYTSQYSINLGLANVATTQCVGKFGLTCQGSGSPLGGPLPSFKSKTRFTWDTPFPNLEFSLAWRYIGGVSLDTGETGCADCHIDAYNYFDLTASYRFKDRYTLHVGVNNLFDRDPPIIGSGELAGTVGNGNTFPQVYDPLGRYLFMNITADF